MKRRTALLLLPALAGAAAAQGSNKPVLTLVSTELGDFVIAVDPKVAPVTVANYLAYVDAKDLDGGAVYRIVTPDNQPNSAHKIEVVQWGMNPPDDQAARRPPIRHETTRETGLRHLDGTVSMARLGPGTASSEFFICIGAQPELDFGGRRNPDGQGFAAFGQVVAGKATLRRLYARGKADDQYLKPPLRVLSVRRVRDEDREAALQLP